MNKIATYLVPCLFALIFASPRDCKPCSTFAVHEGDTQLFAQNYDWYYGDALVFVNRRNVKRTATLVQRPIIWTSKYGSVTFNQYGAGLPISGMNEKGLTIATLWLRDTQLPPIDNRPEIHVLQWIQYYLDMATTVQEVIDTMEEIRPVAFPDVPLHYFLSDPTGESAIIEFINGEVVVRHETEQPWCAITNSSIEKSYGATPNYRPFGGTQELPTGTTSMDRFLRAASALHTADGPYTIDGCFEILNDIYHPTRTYWSNVYDMTALEIHFQTRAQPKRKLLKLADVNFDCDQPMMYFDPNQVESGDVANEWKPYDPEVAEALLNTSFEKTPALAEVPPFFKSLLLKYPDTYRCQNESEETETQSATAPQPTSAPAEPVGSAN